MQLDVFNTHMELYPYVKDDYPVIEDMYVATDKFSGNEFACGYMIDDGKLYLPRGTSVSRLESITGVKPRYIIDSDESSEMSRRHYSLYDPRNHVQEESIKFLKGPEHQLALNLKTGVGKFEPISRKIPCPDEQCGYKRMGDIKPGDRVFGSNGEIINVIDVFPQGVQDIYQITFSDGRVAECGLDHLWAVTHPWSPNKIQVLTTREIMNDYKIYRPHMHKDCVNMDPYEYRYNVQLLSSPVKYPHRDVPVDPYTLGALIGNGCLTENCLAISSGDDFVPSKIAKRNGFELIERSEYNYTYYFREPSGEPSHGRRITTAELFKDLPEMIGKKSHEKEIPEIYLYNDLHTRMELLRGLMDTDGSIVYNGGKYDVQYSSCSKKLLEQIRWIIISLGFISNISSTDRRFEKYIHDYHASVRIRVPQEFKPLLFSNPKKLAIAEEAARTRCDVMQKFKYLKIKDIKYLRQEEAQCIMVDSPDHLYLTEDFIVTHNTFCVAYASSELNEKTIIITPDEGLKQQWISTYNKMFDYRPKTLMNIAGSDIITAIMEDMVDEADVYFVNHQTLRSYLMQTNGYQFHNFFKKIKVGIKVYDESHKDFANILLVDFFTNTNRTWYLTATFDRSDKTESVCFKRAFQSVISYGEVQSAEIVRKHVIYHIINVNSRISPKDRARLMGHPGFTAAKYGRYAFFDDQTDTAYKSILQILNKTKNMEGKVLIFVPIIDAVDEVVKKLRKDFPDKSCAAYHSKVSKEDKAIAEKKDIIVSTIKSCGTGKDIPGLRAVICAEPVASKVVAEQMIGRLRPYSEDKDTYFFDIVDRSIPPLTWWHRGRFKKIQTLVKKTENLDM